MHRITPTLALAGLALAACSGPPTAERGTTLPAAEASPAAGAARVPAPALALSSATQTSPSLVAAGLDALNRALAERGSTLRVARAEYVTVSEPTAAFAESPNHVVFAADHQLRLDSRWVPGDPRRGGRTDVSYVVSRALIGAPTSGGGFLDAEPAIVASFDTWEGIGCSGLAIAQNPDTYALPSLLLAGGDPTLADIGEVGFVPGALLDAALGEGASDNVIGVTFTFVFIVPSTGAPTDIDHDNRLDTGFKEVWYNADMSWATSGVPSDGTDIQSIALHENGHALELGHMGLVHATFNQGRGNDRLGILHLSPRSVMGAFYLLPMRVPQRTDIGAYCGNYASWPTH